MTLRELPLMERKRRLQRLIKEEPLLTPAVCRSRRSARQGFFPGGMRCEPGGHRRQAQGQPVHGRRALAKDYRTHIIHSGKVVRSYSSHFVALSKRTLIPPAINEADLAADGHQDEIPIGGCDQAACWALRLRSSISRRVNARFSAPAMS